MRKCTIKYHHNTHIKRILKMCAPSSVDQKLDFSISWDNGILDNSWSNNSKVHGMETFVS